MKKIRIAQIGTGHDHANEVMRSLRALSEVFDLVGIAEENPDYIPRLTEKDVYHGVPVYTVEELLRMEDLEAVAIECEEERATYYAQMFAERGVHVHLDKPGSHGADSFEKLIRTVKEKGLVFRMGYMYRYNPLVKKALEMARRGDLGEIYAVEAHMSTYYKKEKQEWLKKHRGGMMYFLGCHDIDLVLQFMGGLPEEVIPMNQTTMRDGVDAEDYGFALFRYPHGVSFVKTTCAEYNSFVRRQLVVCGTKGTFELKPIEMMVPGEPPHMLRARATVSRLVKEDGKDKKLVETFETETFNRYNDMMQAFAEEIRGLIENPCTYDYELDLFRTVMKACRAE